MAEIFEKARELGEAIIESAEYKELKKAELEQEEDEEAIALLKEYSELRTSLAQEIQKGDVSEEEMASVKDLKKLMKRLRLMTTSLHISMRREPFRRLSTR